MEYDAIVIGAGQAGPPLAERLGQAGRRVAVIERHRMGGTCVNVGCIPTKTLVGSARVAYYAREASRFGVLIPGAISVDMALVKARKDEVAGASEQGVTDWLAGMEGVDVIRGHARFVSPGAIEVDAEVYEAGKIFINVGARARVETEAAQRRTRVAAGDLGRSQCGSVQCHPVCGRLSRLVHRAAAHRRGSRTRSRTAHFWLLLPPRPQGNRS